MSLRGRALRLNRAFLRRNADGDRWVTLENGTRALIGSDGAIKGGFGGKYTGQKIGEIGKKKTTSGSGVNISKYANQSPSHAGVVEGYRKQGMSDPEIEAQILYNQGGILSSDIESTPATGGSDKQQRYATQTKNTAMQNVESEINSRCRQLVKNIPHETMPQAVSAANDMAGVRDSVMNRINETTNSRQILDSLQRNYTVLSGRTLVQQFATPNEMQTLRNADSLLRGLGRK